MTGLHIIILLIYVTGGLLTTAATVAYFQEIAASSRYYRSNLAFGLLIGFIFLPPISWFVVFIFTGFYEHGFQLRRPK